MSFSALVQLVSTPKQQMSSYYSKHLTFNKTKLIFHYVIIDIYHPTISRLFFFYFTNNFFIHKHFFLYIFKTTQQVVDYIKTTGSQTEQEIASDIVLHILDIIMQSEFSLNKQKVRIFLLNF